MQNSHVIQSVKHSTSTDYDGMHINFDAVYQGGSKFVHETRKTQTAHIGFFSNYAKPIVAIFNKWIFQFRVYYILVQFNAKNFCSI